MCYIYIYISYLQVNANVNEVAIFGAASETFSKYENLRDINDIKVTCLFIGRTLIVQLKKVLTNLKLFAMLQSLKESQLEGKKLLL